MFVAQTLAKTTQTYASVCCAASGSISILGSAVAARSESLCDRSETQGNIADGREAEEIRNRSERGAGGRGKARQSRERRPGAARRRSRRTPCLLPRNASDPPVRGAGGSTLRHGADRRVLPPLYRAGGRGRRHAGFGRAKGCAHHELPGPRSHAGLRDGSERGDGGAYRPAKRLFQGQGRLDAHVQPRQGIFSADTESSAPRFPSAQVSRLPRNTGATGASPPPIWETGR